MTDHDNSTDQPPDALIEAHGAVSRPGPTAPRRPDANRGELVPLLPESVFMVIEEAERFAHPFAGDHRTAPGWPRHRGRLEEIVMPVLKVSDHPSTPPLLARARHLLHPEQRHEPTDTERLDFLLANWAFAICIAKMSREVINKAIEANR